MQKHTRYVLLILLLLFVGPFLGASYLYTHPKTLSLKQINNGTLIQPTVSIEPLLQTASLPDDMRRKWLLLYTHTGSCNQACTATLYKMRQVRLALGKESARVVCVVLTISDAVNKPLSPVLQHDFSGMQPIVIDKTHWQAFQTTLPQPANSRVLFLVDPQMQLMMSYPSDVLPRPLFNDLTRLLRVNIR